MVPQNSPSHIQRTGPGKRGTTVPSPSVTVPPGVVNWAMNPAASAAICANCSPETSRVLLGDQPWRRAAA